MAFTACLHVNLLFSRWKVNSHGRSRPTVLYFSAPTLHWLTSQNQGDTGRWKGRCLSIDTSFGFRNTPYQLPEFIYLLQGGWRLWSRSARCSPARLEQHHAFNKFFGSPDSGLVRCGVPRMQKLRSSLLTSQSYHRFSLFTPGVGPSIAWHASPAARYYTVFISIFLIHLTSSS